VRHGRVDGVSLKRTGASRAVKLNWLNASVHMYTAMREKIFLILFY